MAYINLLPPEYRQKRFNFQRNFMITFFVIYIFILIILLFTLNYRIKYINLEYETLTRQLAMVQPGLEKLNGLNQEISDLQKKLMEYKKVGDRVSYSKILIDISSLLPEKVFLSALSIGEENLTLKGEAYNFIEIARFIDNLKAPDIFLYVELGSTFINKDKKTVSFEINAKLKSEG